MADLVCLGELLVDFVPTEGGRRLRHVEAFERAAGGAPANVAVGFRRLGGTSRFIGKVGQDEFGFFLEETLQSAGVDTDYLFKDVDALTTLAFVSLRADGERDFAFYRRPGADTLLRPDELTAAAIAGANVYHFGSISLLQEPSRSATLELAQLAAEQGTLVSYDPNLRPALWTNADVARTAIFEGLAWANVLKVSEEEMAFLVDAADTEEAAERLFTDCERLRLIAVTKGQGGCTLFLRDGHVDIPGFHATAIDTTGAGDGFMAALLYRLSERLNEAGNDAIEWHAADDFWRAAGRFANAAGAIVVTNRGAIPALPARDEVARLMEQPEAQTPG